MNSASGEDVEDQRTAGGGVERPRGSKATIEPGPDLGNVQNRPGEQRKIRDHCGHRGRRSATGRYEGARGSCAGMIRHPNLLSITRGLTHAVTAQRTHQLPQSHRSRIREPAP
jgi:hypothetical protein